MESLTLHIRLKSILFTRLSSWASLAKKTMVIFITECSYKGSIWCINLSYPIITHVIANFSIFFLSSISSMNAALALILISIVKSQLDDVLRFMWIQGKLSLKSWVVPCSTELNIWVLLFTRTWTMIKGLERSTSLSRKKGYSNATRRRSIWKRRYLIRGLSFSAERGKSKSHCNLIIIVTRIRIAQQCVFTPLKLPHLALQQRSHGQVNG